MRSLKPLIVAKTMSIMVSLNIRTGDPIMKTILLLLISPVFAIAAFAGNGNGNGNIPTEHNEATIAQLQAEMASGKLSSFQLTRDYIARIQALDQSGPNVNSVIE